MDSSQLLARYCECGARLARDNTDTLCASCRKKARDQVPRAPQVPVEFWETNDMQEALASQGDRQSRGTLVDAQRHPFELSAAKAPAGPRNLLYGGR